MLLSTLNQCVLGYATRSIILTLALKNSSDVFKTMHERNKRSGL